jgi:hypothetical protein
VEVSRRAVQQSQLPSQSPADLRRYLRSFKYRLFYKSNLVWLLMNIHNCRCYVEHLRMLLQSLRTVSLAPGGSGSIKKHLQALVRLPRLSGRIACCFWTDLHIADEQQQQRHPQHDQNQNYVISRGKYDCRGCDAS